MKKLIYKTSKEAALYCAYTIKQILEEKPNALICLAAGHTSYPVFTQLINWEREGTISFKEAKIVGLDEWVGLAGTDDGSCYNFLHKNFLDAVGIPEKNQRLFNGKAENLAIECRNIERFIAENNGLDYILLGMGMNGHLALNEPGTDRESRARVVALDDITRKVSNKYFKEQSTVKEGITLGLANILEARVIQLLVLGEAKRECVSKMLLEERYENLPASILKTVNHSELILDELAVAR